VRISLKIISDGETYIFSLVKWGFIRRLLYRLFKEIPYRFTPCYELAIFKKGGNKISVRRPYFVFHFADKEAAMSRMNWMKTLFEESRSGILKLIEEVVNFDGKREGMYLGPGDYLRREIGTR
jgi:hypothetical protein